MKMLEEAVPVQNDGLADVEALEQYVVDILGGKVGETFKDVAVNITFTEGEISSSQGMSITTILAIAGGVIVLAAVIAVACVVIRKKKSGK